MNESITEIEKLKHLHEAIHRTLLNHCTDVCTHFEQLMEDLQTKLPWLTAMKIYNYKSINLLTRSIKRVEKIIMNMIPPDNSVTG